MVDEDSSVDQPAVFAIMQEDPDALAGGSHTAYEDYILKNVRTLQAKAGLGVGATCQTVYATSGQKCE